MMPSSYHVVTETTVVNGIYPERQTVYKDEFPGAVILSKVIDYLLQAKIGLTKAIKIKYEETKTL